MREKVYRGERMKSRRVICPLLSTGKQGRWQRPWSAMRNSYLEMHSQCLGKEWEFYGRLTDCVHLCGLFDNAVSYVSNKGARSICGFSEEG